MSLRRNKRAGRLNLAGLLFLVLLASMAATSEAHAQYEADRKLPCNAVCRKWMGWDKPEIVSPTVAPEAQHRPERFRATPRRVERRRRARPIVPDLHTPAVRDADRRENQARKKSASVIKPEHPHERTRAAKRPSHSTKTRKAEGRPGALSAGGKAGRGYIKEQVSRSHPTGSDSTIKSGDLNVEVQPKTRIIEWANVPGAEQADKRSQPPAPPPEPPVEIAPNKIVSSAQEDEPAAQSRPDPAVQPDEDNSPDRRANVGPRDLDPAVESATASIHQLKSRPAPDGHPSLPHASHFMSQDDKEILAALMAAGQGKGLQRAHLKPGDIVDDRVPLENLPAKVAARVPYLSDLKFVIARDDVMLVNPITRRVLKIYYGDGDEAGSQATND